MLTLIVLENACIGSVTSDFSLSFRESSFVHFYDENSTKNFVNNIYFLWKLVYISLLQNQLMSKPLTTVCGRKIPLLNQCPQLVS
jgi:hypothetical protein